MLKSINSPKDRQGKPAWRECMSLDFSKSIQELRREKKLSQRAVAQELGISQALLSHYEKGVRQPKLDFVRKIASYYGVSADDILGHTGDRRVSGCEHRLQYEIASLIKLVENEYNSDIAELACGYIMAAVSNVRSITDDPNRPFDPRRYSDMKSAEAALYDAAKSNGVSK